MANPDRLTALDSTFLHLEDHSTAHMHVASVMVFEGEAPTLQGARRARRTAACTSCRATASAWRTCRSGRVARCGPTTRTSTPTTTSATPRCRSRRDEARAEAARRAPVLAAPRPLQAAVGDVAGAEHGRRALRADREDPPRARRRHLRRGHHDRPVRHGARTRRADRAADAVEREAAAGAGEAARRGAARALDGARRDGARRPRAAARPRRRASRR